MTLAIDFGESFQTMFDDVAAFIPKLVAALAILIIGWMIAKFIFRLIAKALGKVGVDRLVDRSGLGGPLERAGYPDSGVFLAKIIYWMIMLVVVQMAVNALDITAIKDLLDQLIAWIPKLFVALIILFVTGAVANFVKNLVGGLTATQSWGNLATSAATAGIWFLGGTAALETTGIANGIVNTLFTAVMSALVFILVIKFGVGGIWAARDRFWPGVYDKLGSATATGAYDENH